MTTSDSSITVRELAYADLPDVVTVHTRAFPDSALTQLGREAVRRYYLWQMDGPHDSLNIGAFRDDGTLLGFCVGGMFRGSLGGFLEHNRRFLIRQMLTHPWLLFNPLIRERAQYAIRRLLRQPIPQSAHPTPKAPPSPERAFGILSIAVDPQYHGNGAARLMMAYSEQVARERGFKVMGLTVYKSNGRARRFYEKIGWQAVFVDGQLTEAMRKYLDD